MKKILLGVLILFTILTLSSYASAQVYTVNFNGCLNNVNGDTLLLDYDVNLRTNTYCTIVGSGSYDQDTAGPSGGGLVWLVVNGTYYVYTERWLGSSNVANIWEAFHTNLGRYLGRGWNTFQLWAWGDGTPEFCDFSLTIICDNRGEAWLLTP